MGFPLTRKLNLCMHQMWPVNTPCYFGNKGYSVIKIEDLEAALEKATVVYGIDGDDSVWTNRLGGGDTHKAILINVEELPREPLKHEISLIASSIIAVPDNLIGKRINIKMEEIKE